MESLSDTNIQNFTKAKGILFHLGIFTIKHIREIVPSITYRKINDWDEKNLLSHSRQKDVGWRRFTLVDIIKIQVISALRDFGFQSEAIRKVMQNINRDCRFLNENKPEIKDSLENIIMMTITGKKTFLAVDKKGTISIFFVERDKRKTMDIVDESPVLILPFYLYVYTICRDAINEVARNKSLMGRKV